MRLPILVLTAMFLVLYTEPIYAAHVTKCTAEQIQKMVNSNLTIKEIAELCKETEYEPSGGSTTGDTSDIITSANDQVIEKVLTEMGLQYERQTDSSGKHYYYLPDLQGYKVSIETNKDLAIILLSNLFITEKNPPSLETINKWNTEEYTNRAFLNSDKNSVMESYLVVNGGVTKKTIKEYILRFGKSLINFSKHIKPPA